MALLNQLNKYLTCVYSCYLIKYERILNPVCLVELATLSNRALSGPSELPERATHIYL